MIKHLTVGFVGLLFVTSTLAAQNSKILSVANTTPVKSVATRDSGTSQPGVVDQPGSAEKNLQESTYFFEANKKKPGVVTTKSGLQYKIIQKGSGKPPTPEDFVVIQFRGTFLNGTEFEKTEKDGKSTFKISSVIPGWQESLQMMSPGAKWMVYVPPHLAYGEKGVSGSIGPNTALIFEITLDSILPPPNNEVTDVLEGFKEN